MPNEIRQHKYKRWKVLMAWGFKGLVYNLVMSQFSLRNRLRLGTEKDLFERNILEVLFCAWKQYPIFHKRFIRCNYVLEVWKLKTVFRKWYTETWGHLPEMEISRYSSPLRFYHSLSFAP